MYVSYCEISSSYASCRRPVQCCRIFAYYVIMSYYSVLCRILAYYVVFLRIMLYF
ncbi:hypothetical protein Hanom_Chr09g00770371 [Helianthus anomalus]